MKKVRLTELKAHLDERLREVREDHETLTVIVDQEPVARIVPYEASSADLRVIEPDPGSPAPGDVVLPPPLGLDIDIVDLLLEERQGHR